MAQEKPKVLEWIEGKHLPPKKLTVTRTTRSEYQFILLVRDIAKRTGLKPQFLVYTKEDARAIKAMVEEHSIFSDRNLYVMRGFGRAFVSRLNPPNGTHIIAETDDGELETELFRQDKKRNTLKVLHMLHGLEAIKKDGGQVLPLSDLLKLSWPGCYDHEHFEPFIRLAALMRWTAQELGDWMGTVERTSPMTELKRGQVLPILEEADQQGNTWLAYQMTRAVGDLVYWRGLRSQGYDEEKAKKAGDFHYRRAADLEEMIKQLNQDDLSHLANRRVDLDPLFWRNPALAGELFLLNAPTRLRK